MRRHAWLAALLALLAAGNFSQSDATARGRFTLRVRSKFLEPGRAAGDRPVYLERDGDALRAWAWFVPVDVEVDGDSLKTTPRIHDPRLPAWDLWRHRHGYTRGPTREAAWNTLGDRRLRIDEAEAGFYDAYLIALYRYWTRKALAEPLSGPPPEPVGETRVDLTMQYDATGLAEPVGGRFLIHAWHEPVEVGFTLVPSSSTHPAEWWFQVRDKEFIRYDKQAWRARRAYRKTLLGGYRWNDDFPGAAALTDANGRRLDRLMERGINYWADAALHMGLYELDRELKIASERFRRERFPSGP